MGTSGTPPNRGWRDGDGPAKRPQGAQAGWKKDQGPARPGRKRLSRGLKRLIAALALGAVLGAIVLVILLLRPPKPACLVLLGAKHDTTLALPHNVYGWKALNDLLEATGNSPAGPSALSRWWSASLRLQHGPQELTGPDLDRKWLDFDEKTVILFLALHGGADADGAFFFLEDPAGKKRLPLTKLLEHLADDRLRDKNKVLILDPTQLTAVPVRGLLHNDFVRNLKETELRVPNLVILCASDVDQRSWASEEWRQTAFAHFVIEGLKGAAARGSQRITVQDLYDYVSREVKAWAQANRNAVQTPILIDPDNKAGAIDLVVVDRPYAPPSAPTPDTSYDAQLQALWQTGDELRSAVPSPAVYTPQLWRRYQETLLRYEQLVRAGDPTGAAPVLKKSLDDLKDEIVQARQVKEDACLVHALPMPAVLGRGGYWAEKGKSGQSREDEWQERFARLWAARTADERREAWANLKQWAAENAERKLVQAKVAELVLGKLVDGPPASRADWERARDVLHESEEGSPDRPAEAHFLLMLLRDVDGNALNPATLQLALRVRRLAERVALGAVPVNAKGDEIAGPFHPYSEQVAVWISDRIKAADTERFNAENLLFLSTKEDWDKATAGLHKAETMYIDAAREAVVLRDALATRDQVLAELPYYTHWLASRRLAPDEKMLKGAEELWKAVHALAARLEEPQRKPVRGPSADSLETLTHDVRQQFEAIRTTFAAHREKLNDVPLQDRWQEIEDALSVPLFDKVDDRLALIHNSRGIAGKLNVAGATQGGAVLADPAREIQEAAQRQGRLAVAMLGERYLDNPEPLHHLINRPAPDRWRVALTEAGKRIGEAWARAEEQAAAQTREALTAEDLARAAAPLLRGAALARLLDGSASLPVNPVVAERRWRLHDLLLWQARRTIRDHWFAENDNDDPYYLTAGKAYVQDALALAAVRDEEALSRKRQAEARQLLESELKLAKLIPEGPPRLPVTSEKQVEATWTLKADQGVPAGTVAVWYELEGPLTPSANETPTGRRALREWPPEKVRYAFTSRIKDDPEPTSLPEVAQGAVTLRGVYRGQRITGRVPVTVQRWADIIAGRYPPPPGAGLACRADRNVNEGTIVVVLDASNSMKGQKFASAVSALERVLTLVPKGTKVSLWTFGGDDRKADKTVIKQVQVPEAWDPEDEDQLKRLMRKARAVTPDWNSPIARTMIEALKRDLLDERGLKTMLVLTDGQDTESGGNIPEELLRNFANTDVLVNVVFFQLDDRERRNALDQFGVVKKFCPAGQLFGDRADDSNPFADIKDEKKLFAALEQAMIPRVRLYRSGNPVPPFDGLAVRFADRRVTENLAWSPSLDAGSYDATVYSAERPQGVRLKDGDRLLMTLKRKESAITFERGLFAEEPQNRGKPVQRVGDWLAAVLLNRFTPEGALDQLVTLEDHVHRAAPGGVIEQQRPGFVWAEVHTGGVRRPGLRWGDEWGYPAPALRLNVVRWPGDMEPAVPELHLWWVRDREPPAQRTLTDEELRELPRPTQLDGAEVVIESVALEKRKVRPAYDAVPREQDCLVVRVAHAKDRPLWVQLKGHTGGEEHFYYSQSDRYTAVFMGVTEATAKKFTLGLVSLPAFKNAALYLKFDKNTENWGPPSYTARIPDKVTLQGRE